jgi:hypothetical protein
LLWTLVGGKWSVSHPGHLTFHKTTELPTGQEAGWAPELVPTCDKEKYLALLKIKVWSPSPQPSHYTDWTIPAHSLVTILTELSQPTA